MKINIGLLLNIKKKLSTSETNRNVHLKRDMTFGENPGSTNSRSAEKDGRRREKIGASLNRKSCLSNEVYSVLSSLSCLYFNADSMLNKRNELKLLIYDQKQL